MAVRKEQVQKLIGQQIVAVRKDKSVVTGKLVSIKGNRLIVKASKGKQVKTSAFIPLVLFDLLAIGTYPYGYGGFYGGYGYPGYFW